MLAELCQKHGVPLPLVQGLLRIEATPPRKGRRGVVVRSRELIENYARSGDTPITAHDTGGGVPVLATSAPSLQFTEVTLSNFCLFKKARALPIIFSFKWRDPGTFQGTGLPQR